MNMDADIFAIQETKMQEEQKAFDFPGYYEYWNCAERKRLFRAL
jgi:exodeoxyribonuclease-3